VDLGTALLALLVCGVIAGVIAHRKQLGFGKFLVLGFLLGIFGILWAVLAPPGAPAGMRSVTCRRCNARQNIPAVQIPKQCRPGDRPRRRPPVAKQGEGRTWE
jgi:hypothetical protein